ncbi:(5-formylfuran-3-yl)methyl phosphate synthase, partial [Methyloversatilis discipulorum]|uniref:(5-formylfuran-3-yl)methyl phosphate synthase n=1 Tax=Methyloversatilis discipulorum TaxID=1119528 RepID=UPI003137D6A2
LKQPADGALGALPPEVISEVVGFVAGRTLTSATAGNIEPDAEAVQAAMQCIAATGVDYVKAGLFPAAWQQGGRDYAAVRACLGGLVPLNGVRRIAVMFADLAPPLDLVDAVVEAGFDGIMVDTALKTGHSLPDVATDDWLASFIGGARARGLLCGLAGSLREGHIAPLARLAPDYLGFRGALCAGQARAHALGADAVRRVRGAVQAAQHLAA